MPGCVGEGLRLCHKLELCSVQIPGLRLRGRLLGEQQLMLPLSVGLLSAPAACRQLAGSSARQRFTHERKSISFAFEIKPLSVVFVWTRSTLRTAEVNKSNINYHVFINSLIT